MWLFVVAVVLAVLWILGWLAFHIAGAAIHALLVLALVALVAGFLAGRRAA